MSFVEVQHPLPAQYRLARKPLMTGGCRKLLLKPARWLWNPLNQSLYDVQQAAQPQSERVA